MGRGAAVEEDRARRDQRDQFIRVHRQVVPMPGVFAEIGGGPVRRGDVVNRLAKNCGGKVLRQARRSSLEKQSAQRGSSAAASSAALP